MKSVIICWPESPSCGWVVSTPSMTKRFSEPEAPSIEMPPSMSVSWEAPAACATIEVKSRPLGSSEICSEAIVAVVEFSPTAIWTRSPVTTTVSMTELILRVTFTVALSPRATEIREAS